MKRFAVCAGHGGASPGATYWGTTEAALMTELRDLVADRLRAAGHLVHEDEGNGSENLPLAEAVKLVHGADVAIELHTNASVDPRATGVEVVSLRDKSAMATSIAGPIARALGLKMRGLKGWKPPEETPHKTLAFCSAGGLVVEVFFLSSQADFFKYRAKTNEVAEAIANALMRA